MNGLTNAMGGERERAWRGRRATGRQIRCRTKAFFHYPPVLPPAEQSLRQRGRPTVPAAKFPPSLCLARCVCPPLYILTIFAVCGGWSATKTIQALFKMGKPAQTSIFTSRAPRGKLDIVQFLDLTRARFPSSLPSLSLSCKSFLHDRLFCRATCALSALARELSHDFAPLPPSLPLPDMHRPLSLLFLRYRESGGISRRHKMQVVTASFLLRLLSVKGAQGGSMDLPCKQRGEHAKMIPSPHRLALPRLAGQFEF